MGSWSFVYPVLALHEDPYPKVSPGSRVEDVHYAPILAERNDEVFQYNIDCTFIFKYYRVLGHPQMQMIEKLEITVADLIWNIFTAGFAGDKSASDSEGLIPIPDDVASLLPPLTKDHETPLHALERIHNWFFHKQNCTHCIRKA